MYVSVSWDEENSPKPFLACWAVAQLLFIFVDWLIRTHTSNWIGYTQPGVPDSETHTIWLAMFFSLFAGVLYLNLIMNGFWQKNPDLADPTDSNGPEMVDLALNQTAPVKEEATPQSLFDQSLLKNPYPVVTREEIQWKRMLLASVCAGTLIISIALTQ